MNLTRIIPVLLLLSSSGILFGQSADFAADMPNNESCASLADEDLSATTYADASGLPYEVDLSTTVNIFESPRKEISAEKIGSSLLYGGLTGGNGGTLAGNKTVCHAINEGTLTLTNYIGNIKEWHSSPSEDFSVITVIANTADTYTYTNLEQTAFYRVLVVDNGVEALSNSVRINLLPAITGNIISSDQSICSDEEPDVLIASLPGGGNGHFTYQWQQSGDNTTFNDITGATKLDYQADKLPQTTYFRRRVISNGQCTNTSESLQVSVTEAPDLSSPMHFRNICEGQDVTIDVKNPGAAITYHVLDVNNGNTEVAGGRTDADILYMTVPSSVLPAGGNSFRFILRADNAGLCVRSYSTADVVIYSKPNLDLFVSDGGDICSGNDGLISLESSEAGHKYYVMDTGRDNKIVANAKGTGGNIDFIIPAAELPTTGLFSYAVKVVNVTCEGLLKNTGSFRVIVSPVNSLSVSDPFVCAEAPPPITEIIVSDSRPGVKYQLRLDSNNSVQGAAVEGTGGAIALKTPTPIVTTAYNVLATAVAGDAVDSHCAEIELIDKAIVTIVPVPDNSMEVSDPVVCQGDAVNIIVKNTQTDVNYILRSGTTDMETGAGTDGEITFNLVPPPNASTTYRIFARSTLNQLSCAEILLPDLANVSIIPEPDITAAVSDLEVCEAGADITISVNPTSEDVAYMLKEQEGSYTQTLSGTGGILNFTVPEPMSDVVYEVYATPTVLNSAGTTCHTVKLNNEANIIFAPDPDIGLTVEGGTICEGSTGSVTIYNSEIGIQYQLRKDIGDVNVGIPIEGTGGTIRFEGLTPASTSHYEIIATSSVLSCAEVVLSTKPRIDVIPSPNVNLSITPTNAVICNGETQMITVNGTQTGVHYQLRTGNTELPGREFDGNGASQTFTLTPSTGARYNIIATPIINDGSKICDGVMMTQVVDIDVEGPITIQDISERTHVCSGSIAHIRIEANNGEGGFLKYQWRMDDVAIVDGGNFSGATTSTLSVSDVDVYSNAGSIFSVEVSTPQCAPVVSGGTRLISSSPPDAVGFALTASHICAGSDGVINFKSRLTYGFKYRFTYNLSGANTVMNKETVALVSRADGSGTFTVPASELLKPGSTAIVITKIDYEFGNNCSIEGLAVSNVIESDKKPDISLLSASTNNVCAGNPVRIRVNGSLENAIYKVTYNLSGANSAIASNAELVFEAGTGDFHIPVDKLPNTGLTDITVTRIEYTDGKMCAVDVTDVLSRFEIEPKPNVAGLLAQSHDICSGNDAMVNLSGALGNGQYRLSYNLSGANSTNGNAVDVELINGDGTAAFPISQSLLPDAGLTNMQIYEVSYASGQQCNIPGLAVNAGFNTEQTPHVGSLKILTRNICEGDELTVLLTSNLPDGKYRINCQISGANTINDLREDISLTSGDGNMMFTVPAASLTETGLNTLTVLDIMDLNTLQGCRVNLSEQLDFEIGALPTVSGMLIEAENTCVGQSATVNITSRLSAGSYQLSYQLTNAPELGGVSTLVEIGADGSGSFVVPAYDLNQPGTTTVMLTDIMVSGTLNCGVSELTLTDDISVEPLPDFSSMEVVVANTCSNEDANVNISSSLKDGRYEIKYELLGDNNTFPLAQTLDFVGGLGSFTISAANFPNDGTTVVHLIGLKSLNGAKCEVSESISVTGEFTVMPLPLVQNLRISANDICEGNDIEVSAMSRLSDGSYNVQYYISGVNVVPAQLVSIDIRSGDGTFNFNVPAASVPNTGQSKITITSLAYKGGLACVVPANLQEEFRIVPVGTIFDGNLSIADICSGDDATVVITTGLADSEYHFDYDLLGVNLAKGNSARVGINAGVGSFTVSRDVLSLSGRQTISVTGIGGCTAPDLALVGDFEIEGPVSIALQPVPDDRCAGERIKLTSFADNLGAGDLYFRWMSSNDAGQNYNFLDDRGGYSNTQTPTLSIEDNTPYDGTLYKMQAFTNNCSAVESNPVLLTVLTGSACGEGLENIPDVITPNGDELNDYWKIEGVENYPLNHVWIFNRRGGEVYEVKGYNNTDIRFEGRANKGSDKELPDGTYFYIINPGDGSSIFKGFLVINR